MVVQHNITAMNANRMLGVTSGLQAKSTEKLSSGYKINRAADDAAGLSISEKMRKQIRGLSQASDNAEDGISCVQTAEGALTEVHSMLQRMNELAVKAGNGTMSEDDRQNVQDEIDQLVDEIDRVSETTKFNETYLLKGDDTSNGNTKSLEANAEIGQIDGLTVTAKADKTYTDNDDVKIGKVIVKSSDTNVVTVDADNLTEAAGNIAKITTDGTEVVVTKNDGKTDTYATVDKFKAAYAGLDIAGAGAVTISKTLDTATANTDDTVTGTYTGNLNSYKVGDSVNVKLAVGASGETALSNGSKALLLSFQVGADTTSENKISVTMDSMSAKSIGVDGIKVTGSDSTNADKAVDTISDAIKKVSKQRSALGAVQNRLEHTISNLDNVVENTTSAESRIRDTDMAEEMVSYSKNNILMQAGQSMLAQANQQNQGVLSLLQ
jgi:flagellin